MKRSSKYLVSAFVGLAAGLCAIAGMVLGPGRGSLLWVPPVADPGWTGEWAAALVPAAVGQQLALTTLLGLLIAALFLAAGAALVCGVLLLAEERIVATRSVAIQSALGIDRWRLALELVRDVGPRGHRAGAVALGVVLLCGLAIRWTWPDQVLGWSSLDGALVFSAVMAATGVVIATTVLPGLAIWRHKRLFAFLSRQSSNLPDRGESFGRDVTVVCQVAVAVSVLVLIGGLVGSSPDRAGVDPLVEDSVAIPMEVAASTPGPSRARLYESLLTELAERPDVEAESIASPGALVGLGSNGIVMTECGRCFIGGFLLPFLIATADHHAVGPGFFGLVGYEIGSGREFTPTDVLGSDRVAIVNRSLADRYFERGDPLGRGIQIGGPRGEWFDVIGVVDEPRAVAMGAQSSQRPALYLSALQVPPARSMLIVRPSPSSGADIERLAALIPSAMASGPPRTGCHRSEDVLGSCFMAEAGAPGSRGYRPVRCSGGRASRDAGVGGAFRSGDRPADGGGGYTRENQNTRNSAIPKSSRRGYRRRHFLWSGFLGPTPTCDPGNLASTHSVGFGLDVVPLSCRSVGRLGPGPACGEPRSSPGAIQGIVVGT